MSSVPDFDEDTVVVGLQLDKLKADGLVASYTCHVMHHTVSDAEKLDEKVNMCGKNLCFVTKFCICF